MTNMHYTFGIVDNRFLAQSIGLLDPPHPLTVDKNDSIAKTIEILKSHKIGCVVVTDAEGKVAGIFSERDAMLKVVLTPINMQETPISEVMTPKPTVATMTTRIAYALNMMSQGGFRHIPIVDDENYPVGIISVKNIIDFIVKALTKDLAEVHEEG